MVKVVKLAKYIKHPSKANKIAKQIKKLQQKRGKSQHIGIKTYKNKLKLHPSKDTKFIIANKKSSTKLNTNLNNTNKLFSRKSKIIQSDVIRIPNMKSKSIKESNIKMTKISTKNISALDDKYTIAIPSYKRSDIIQTHTLAVLNRHKINPKCITIFVANQEEHDIYKTTLPSFLYNNLIIGVLGLKNQRNFISEYYPEGAHIVEMDDDINSIMQLVVRKGSKSSKSRKGSKINKKTVKPIEDLDAFIRRAFEMCTESNIFLWGIYPLVNPYFMTYKITTDLRFIVGPMWGMINRHRKDLKLTVDEKENSERTLQFWVVDGAVLRFNNVGIETKYYKNKGGMQAEDKDRKVEALKSVYYLNKMYPKLTKISLTKKNGMPEIKMSRAAFVKAAPKAGFRKSRAQTLEAAFVKAAPKL